jgi:preprotein translocase subunit SecF
VGVVVGTYSSIFVASPVLIFWQRLLPSKKRLAVGRAAR